jgi:hypothetical protein
MALRRQVLKVYTDILRTARKWQASSGIELQTIEERNYIKEEARRLFRKNKALTEVEDIRECLREANARLELAVHYGNPYPRPVNAAPFHVPSVKSSKRQRIVANQSKPVYIRSQDT